MGFGGCVVGRVARASARVARVGAAYDVPKKTFEGGPSAT
eukprot:CAMPEP_0117461898 /NCGR_PEP_ID=MMETSP0784-20121206/2770_1 /TAXON_ID=39447 /ORGANISM="" /LENGTH=39 /DNA_ID= /DNA_START= /DNA_END= /DNA_ORIENTATION=